MSLRFFKTALPDDEAAAVKRRADYDGVSISAYLRAALMRDLDRASVAHELAALSAVLPGATSTADATMAEMLALLRLVAARVDPQAAARIAGSFKG